MTSSTQDRTFIADVIDQFLLERSIDWISNNMEPEDVFGEARLKDWAKDNGMVEEENE